MKLADAETDVDIVSVLLGDMRVKLVLEVNRLGKETGRYELDGVVSVVDAENWGGKHAMFLRSLLVFSSSASCHC